MWSIGKDHSVLSVRGDGYTCSKASTLEEMFECPRLRDQTIEKHEQALRGEAVSFFVENEGRVYWTKLVPRMNEFDDVVGVVGVSWDVTSNAVMIHCLEEVIKMLEEKKDPGEILPIAKRGLSASRLRKMLDDKEKADA
jgi:hypothetical protein